MKPWFNIFLTLYVSIIFVSISSFLWAQEGGIPTEAIKNAFQQILAGADKNGDGKLSMQECLAMSTAKTMEKNCKYWDADGDGLITEDEYVQQAKKIGNKK